MKRIHLFEFEDFPWFPNWLRIRMTRFITAMHKLLNSSEELAELLDRLIQETGTTKVLDLCSGSGGPMPEVLKILQKKRPGQSIDLTLSDLYPNETTARKYKASDENISYLTTPLNATDAGNLPGIRTLICGMHHMKPNVARGILKSAQDARQPLCVFEISDNSFPKALWWTAFPINILTILLITPIVRPMSWQQIVFTYLLPVLPLIIAWDGAVSNARTYTLDDLDQLLKGLNSPDYRWEKGVIKGKSKKLYLLGIPG